MTHQLTYISLYIPVYNNTYISWWVYFVTGLNFVLQQPLTAVLAKTKADIAKKSSYCYSSRWPDDCLINAWQLLSCFISYVTKMTKCISSQNKWPVKVELVKIRTIFELTGGKSWRPPPNILSTVFSSMFVGCPWTRSTLNRSLNFHQLNP